ncbi:hypothetical protein PV08_11185 [Exophiala spinifera]|uniref:Cytochrome P450 n=1 Tax=Exophiala spinifera TaxID=91928 RepID=A0A0D2BFS4_9EURO|nr:uncharacterized protein PV08_11185 [Exophiala spinifera]KIW10224.1 hypothetical protein PV08_11185 [Exophiala spinifera]
MLPVTQLFGSSTALACYSFLLIFVALKLRQFLALRHIPGPFLASLTDFWFLYVMRLGDYKKQSLELHNKYGPLVRYGPNRVLFSDVEAISVVYGTKAPFQKARSYDVITPYINGKLVPSLITLRDEREVSAIKRHISHAFSNTAILDYEHHIDHTIQSLVKALQANGPELDLSDWLGYFAFDTLCRIGFSDDTEMTARGEDVGNTLLATRTRNHHWDRWLALPALESFWFKNRYLSGGMKADPLTNLAKQRFQARVDQGGAASTHHDLLDRYFQAQQKSPELFDNRRIVALIVTIINAGSETTGSSLAVAYYYILKHPHVYARIKQEIDEAGLSFPPQFRDVVKLKYVEACIKESMRVRATSQGPMERVVPPEGMTISGVFIAPGTVVAANKSASTLDPRIYDPSGKHPVHEYIPERWLGVDPSRTAQMDLASLPFSYGKRTCLGIHLAWCEMLKCLTAMFMRFDVDLKDRSFELEIEKGMIALVTPKGLPVIIKPRA